MKLAILLLFYCSISSAQNLVYRIKADFSIIQSNKEIDIIQSGTLYYDLNNKKLVYNMFFPENIDWVVHDTSFYTIIDKKIVSILTVPEINKENIIHLAITNNLNDFGLSKIKLYDIVNVASGDDGMVITSYKPNIYKKDLELSEIIISNKNNLLYGVVFLGKNKEILKKIIIENYTKIKGFNMPSRILEINYSDKKEIYKITKFSSFIVNENENENFYNYNLNFSRKL